MMMTDNQGNSRPHLWSNRLWSLFPASQRLWPTYLMKRTLDTDWLNHLCKATLLIGIRQSRAITYTFPTTLPELCVCSCRSEHTGMYGKEWCCQKEVEVEELLIQGSFSYVGSLHSARATWDPVSKQTINKQTNPQVVVCYIGYNLGFQLPWETLKSVMGVGRKRILCWCWWAS